MAFITKTLTLYKNLWFSTKEHEDSVQSESLWKYRCGVKNNEMNPQKELFLLDGHNMGNAIKNPPKAITTDCTAISVGTYLFLQGTITDKNADNHILFLNASEELFLESLWLEKKIKNDVVFLRCLEEDGKRVFQLFREIEST